MSENEIDNYVMALSYGNVCQRAVSVAVEHRGVRGARHKQWVIDQMLRVLCGQAYTTVVGKIEAAGEVWDEGVAP